MSPSERERNVEPRIFQHQQVVFYGEDPLTLYRSHIPAMCEDLPNAWSINWGHCDKVGGTIMYISGEHNFQSGVLIPSKNRRMTHCPVDRDLISIPLDTYSLSLSANVPAMFIYRSNPHDLSIFVTPNALESDQRIFQRMAQQMDKIDTHLERIAHGDKHLLSLKLCHHKPIIDKAFKVNADQRPNNNWGHK